MDLEVSAISGAYQAFGQRVKAAWEWGPEVATLGSLLYV